MDSLKHPILRLFVYLRLFSTRFWFSIFASIINKILDLMPPLLVAWVIDSISGHPPHWILFLTGPLTPFRLAAFLAILAVVIFALESFFQWLYNLGFMTLSQDVQHRLRLDAYQQLQQREIAFFEDNSVGNSMAILNDDINQLERFLNTSFNEIVQLIVLVIFAVFIMVATSWPLAVFALTPIPFVIWGSLWYQRKISPRYQTIRNAVGNLNSRLENNISGISVVKSFTAEEFEMARVQKSSDHYRLANLSAVKLHVIYVPLIRLAIAFGFGGVLLIGSYWILSGQTFLTIGELVLFSMMIQRLLWPLTRMGGVLDEVERAAASIRRIFELVDVPSSITDPEKPVVKPSIKGDISFENVCFYYHHHNPVLKNLSFSIQSGEMVGLAGMTGSGKSTLIKCLLRFYEISSGTISIDTTPIQHFSLMDLRQHIALVSQDTYLFQGSIFENIAYGLDHVDLQTVQHAAELAELNDFVQTLPNKYDSIVGEKGIKLSGGQRQRLSIARAILKNAPIMIFDEATSSVDTETERAIQSNLTTLTQGKTALIIAHRLSTIRNADRILVLDKGRVLEEGSHDDLLLHQQLYADLWAVQIGQASRSMGR